MTTARQTITRNNQELQMTALRYELIRINIENGTEHLAREAWGDEQIDAVLTALMEAGR